MKKNILHQEDVLEVLSFIGLGIDQSPSLRAIKIMKECDSIFFESYTSPIINTTLFQELEAQGVERNKMTLVKREFVEDGRNIIELAKSSNIALASSGDPLVATTHQELRERAIKNGVKTIVIHGSSILSAITGETGLHSYNFGRVVTMTDEPMQYTAYNTIYENLLKGLHTTILLQWDETRGFFLTPAEAIKGLEESERDIKFGSIGPKTIIFVVSRLGSSNPAVVVSDFESLPQLKLGEPPHTLVIPGRMHFTEIEEASAITGLDPSFFLDNSKAIEKISVRMLDKYSKKTLAALERARKAASIQKEASTKVNFEEIFENVECYTQDAVRFLNEGKSELAVLSIGYAEGLLDSLRFAGLLEFEW
jgi:diphthine synthase